MRTTGATVRLFLFDEVEPSGETGGGTTAGWSHAASTQPQVRSGELQLRSEQLEVPQLSLVLSLPSDVLQDGGCGGQQGLSALRAGLAQTVNGPVLEMLTK